MHSDLRSNSRSKTKCEYLSAWVVAALILRLYTVSAAEIDRNLPLAAENDSENWLTYGLTFYEQRFVPLDQL